MQLQEAGRSRADRSTDRQTEEGKEGLGKERWRWDFKQRIGPGVQRDAFLSGVETEGMEGCKDRRMAGKSEHENLQSYSL